MDRWKSRGAKSQTGAESEGRQVRREKIRRKKMRVCEKVGKSRNTVFFRCFVAPEGRKVGSLKRRVRRHLGRWEMKSCTPLWREADFEVNRYKNTWVSEHFLELRGRKSARRCGAKHISKWKCTKHTSVGPLLEVAMSKKCTPLWREAPFEVKMYKTLHVRATFGGSDVEKVHAVVARSTFRSQNVKNTRGSDHFWRFRCRFASLHYNRLHYTTLNYTPLHYITLHYTTLHNTTTITAELHSTTLHYIPLH